jgi:hypothetical protein
MRSFILVSFTKYYQGDQIKEDDMGRPCSTHGRDEKCIQNFGWVTDGRRLLRRPGRTWEDNIRMDLKHT